MRALATALILLIGPGALLANGRTEMDLLRARCSEQERQIRALEKEIETLHSQLALERRRSRGAEPSAAAAAPLPPVREESYTVKSGDTLSAIARRYRTSADRLMKANGIDDPTRLRVGQKLTLPEDARAPQDAPAKPAAKPAVVAAKPAPKPEPAPAIEAAGRYEVKRGDTLYGIARSHKMSISQLKALNPKVADKIIVGQSIAVSGKPQIASNPPLASTRSKSRTIATTSRAPAPKAAARKPAPVKKPAPVSKPAETKKPATPPAPSQPTEVVENAPREKPAEEAPAAPRTISSIIVMDEVSLGDLASKHGTNTEQLNALNNWSYKSNLILARGSEVYVPGR